MKIKIDCPECGREIGPADLDLVNQIARCSHCDHLFDYGMQRSQAPAFQKLGKPDSISIMEGTDGITYSRNWFNPMAYFLLAFCVFWDGFLLFWYSFSIQSGNLMINLFPLIHVAVGIGLTYYTIALFLNRTDFTITFDEIIVKTVPLTFLNDKRIPKNAITQVYVKESKSYNKGRESIQYQLKVITSDERDITLASRIAKSEEALYLEQELEARLKIRPKAVKGEFQG